MTNMTVFDPAMCCSTGICGTEVDQKLIDFAADLDWLKAQGVQVRRINLSQEPTEFVADPAIKALMEESGSEGLPAIVVDGRIDSTSRHPARAELAGWAGIAAPEVEVTEAVRELIALGAAIGASCEPCLKYHVKKSRELGLSDAAMREAIAVGRMIREASAKNILGLADKLIPDEGTAAKGCGVDKAEEMQASPEKEKTGACC